MKSCVGIRELSFFGPLMPKQHARFRYLRDNWRYRTGYQPFQPYSQNGNIWYKIPSFSEPKSHPWEPGCQIWR